MSKKPRKHTRSFSARKFAAEIGRLQRSSVCPTPEKICFKSRLDALLYIETIKITLVPYLCHCGMWHNTSKEDNEQ